MKGLKKIVQMYVFKKYLVVPKKMEEVLMEIVYAYLVPLKIFL
jgi:hypothetical protein